MKLIVGLGNPGKEYDKTRHNIGFHFIDYYASKKGIAIDKKKMNGYYAEITEGNERVILLKPLLYMNLSGIVVKKYMTYFKIAREDILIINDDLDMPVGKIKLRPTGTSGGHNGLKNIEENIKSIDYKRLKIGISKDKEKDIKDYVLGKFSKEEEKILESLNDTIISAIDDFMLVDFEQVMAKYNRK